MPLAAGEEATPLHVEVTSPDFTGGDEKEDHSDRHVCAVKARDHEEAGAELDGAPGITPRPHPLMDELGPLESLHPDEGGAERRSQEHEQGGFDPVASVAEIHRHR